ncbi:MAG TPA: hypothetical protein VE819_00385 [Steroidobacteraceae bacterium]|jgi:hypothetical protein|nr:hypothetical protein [Steroidobacteraceae bacterium]
MKLPSRRALEELGSLQQKVAALAAPRSVALRMFAASRRSTTLAAQREFWLEFCWLDQEYRDTVRRLARFCLEHTEGLQAAGQAPPGLRTE